MCEQVANQSPVNIKKESIVTVSKGLDKIKYNYVTSAKSIINNGHTIQVNMDEGSYIEIDNIHFDLLQFHFHTPSENQIESENFPLEVHFVHADVYGNLAVVAVLFKDGKKNEILEMIWDKMPSHTSKKRAFSLKETDVQSFLQKKKAYYRFDGSLTTPPCTEGVRWFVYQEYATVSKEQIHKFEKAIHGHDNRPVQPIHARKILLQH